MTPEQSEFLKSEFNLDKKALSAMDKEGWSDIREKCSEIAISEYDEDDDGESVLSSRFLVAESITDITFKMMKAALTTE